MTPGAHPVPPGAHPLPPGAQPVPVDWLRADQLRAEHFPTTVTRDGRVAWAMGLLGFIPLPGAAIVLASLGMVITGLLQYRSNPVGRRTGRRAALFGGLSLLAVAVFFTTLFGILPVLEERGMITDDSVLWWVVMIPLSMWTAFVGPITCVVLGIVALTRPIPREKAERIYAAAGHGRP